MIRILKTEFKIPNALKKRVVLKPSKNRCAPAAAEAAESPGSGTEHAPHQQANSFGNEQTGEVLPNKEIETKNSQKRFCDKHRSHAPSRTLKTQPKHDEMRRRKF